MSDWHIQEFSIQREDYASTRWWVDVFLIDTLVRDCLHANRGAIDLWRVHRRAEDDATGHKFSFLYRAPTATHTSIAQMVSAHRAMRVLSASALLRGQSTVDKGATVRATSDPAWPGELQDAWPYYIMGVSQMVLELIDGLRDSPPPALDAASADDCEAYYCRLMDRLSTTWQQWGSHALLHHLNAVFGYVPVIVNTGHLPGLLTQF